MPKRLALLLALLIFALPTATADQGSENQLDPREEFNRALKEIQADFQTAETLLMSARSRAGSDGELRFRATYNLGCLEVNRADSLIQEQPEDALQHLQRAADWFLLNQ